MRPPRPSPSKPHHIFACAVAMVVGAPAKYAVAAATRPAELSLAWSTPTGCPPAADVEAEFVRLLGGPARTPSSKRIYVQATVRRLAADRWSVQLDTDIDGAKGHRRVEGDSCPSVAAAAALILALTIDPDAASRAQTGRAESRAQSATTATSSSRAMAAPETRASTASSSSSQTPSPSLPPAPPVAVAEPVRPPPKATPAEPVVAAQPAEEAREITTPPVTDPPIATVVATPKPTAPWPVHPFLRTFVGGALALLPQPAATAGLAIGARRGRFDGEISGLASQERRAQSAERPTAAGDFRLLAAGARGCGRIGSAWLITRLCGGVEIERISARATGVEMPSWGTAIMGAAIGTGVLAVPLGTRFELGLEVSASVRPYRPAFTLENLGRLFVVPAAAAAASLGLAVNL